MDLQDQIVAARALFDKLLPEDQRDAIESYDSEAVNSRLSIRSNLIMGDVTQQRANAEEKIHELIRGVLSELDMFREILLLSRDVEVGIGGQRLPTAARQSIVLARALMKRPDIVLVNDALNAHDREARDRILRNVLELLPEATFVWIDSEMPNAQNFDEVLVLRNGRIDKRIVEAQEQEVEVQAIAEEAETPQELQAEAAALARVPIFREIRSGNLKLLALGSKRVAFDAGEVLFNQGRFGRDGLCDPVRRSRHPSQHGNRQGEAYRPQRQGSAGRRTCAARNGTAYGGGAGLLRRHGIADRQGSLYPDRAE